MQDRTRSSEQPIVRRKLVVGPADDRYEREADRVAKQVMTEIGRGPAPVANGGEAVARVPQDDEELALKRVARSPATDGAVRRNSIGADGGELDQSTTASIDSARSGGQPLEPTLRRSMEGAFGADFSSVRVHTGATADRLSADLGARAFTTGSDVFVRSSDYQPGSHAGRELLAHELTHVVQQGGSRPLDPQD